MTGSAVLLLIALIISFARFGLNYNNRLAQRSYCSGRSAVVVINHNRSTLNPRSWRSDHVSYGRLDRLSRTTGSRAYLDRNNLAHDTLRQRQFVHPSGWHQRVLGDQMILNRGHLIAYSLSKGINQSGRYQAADPSGDQNNARNLFTQTAFSNQKLQTIYESQVRHALYRNCKVIFQAQPVFRGRELMARGVHLQAISTDRSLDFNVYLFNVQPGVKFDYTTGESSADPEIKVPIPKNAPRFRDDAFRWSPEHGRRNYRYRPTRRGRFPERKLLLN